MGFSLPYDPKYYGLQKQMDGTWIYQAKWIYPGSIFFKPQGRKYRLSAKPGHAADKAIRDIYWSKSLSFIMALGAAWFLITGFPVKGSFLEFMQAYRYLSIPIALLIVIIIQNYRLRRVARFCRTVGSLLVSTK